MSRTLVLMVAVAIAIPQSHAALRAGTAIVDITPKEWPLPLRGAFHPRIVDSARDPLHVRSLVLDDGKTTIALALVDSCMVHREVLDPAKEQISKATGIAEANIMVCATHTHSAPFSNAIHGTPEERAYQKLLLAGIVESVSSAAGNRQAATIGWGSHELTDEVFNRRWHLKAGKMPANPFGSKE
ncbi:MAG: neutral/alkaline non-lysosomal ceramidase N-terminal domain-containing protein, partial [Akkermansiaceae bacterium]